MTNNNDDLTRLLAAVEPKLSPTDSERERARAAFLKVLDESELDSTTVEELYDIDGLSLVDGSGGEHAEMLDVFDDVPNGNGGSGRRVVMALVAATIVLVVGVGVVVSNQQNDVVDTTDVTDEAHEGPPIAEEPTPTATPIEESSLDGAPIGPGVYSVVLDGTTLDFELRDDRIVRRLEDDAIVLEAVSQGIGPTPKILTIAISSLDPGTTDLESWLTDSGIEHEARPAVADGEPASDIELTVDDPSCETTEPCQLLPLQISDPSIVALIDGENRVLTRPLIGERLLLVLDTSGGNRSGNTQRAYNTVVSTLTVTE